MSTTRPYTSRSARFLREYDSNSSCCTYEYDKEKPLHNAQISVQTYLTRNRSPTYALALQRELDAKTADELNKHFADMRKARYEEWIGTVSIWIIGAIVGIPFGWLIVIMHKDSVEADKAREKFRKESAERAKKMEEDWKREAERKKRQEEFEQTLKDIEPWAPGTSRK
jgi:hypothetical protein